MSNINAFFVKKRQNLIAQSVNLCGIALKNAKSKIGRPISFNAVLTVGFIPSAERKSLSLISLNLYETLEKEIFPEYYLLSISL